MLEDISDIMTSFSIINLLEYTEENEGEALTIEEQGESSELD